MPLSRRLGLSSFAAICLALAACSELPTIGPGRRDIEDVAQPGTQSVQVVDLDDTVVRRLLALRHQRLFSETLGQAFGPEPLIGSGDTIEVDVWEAPPAALFGAGTIDPRAPGSVHAVTMPDQEVDRSGYISVPFAGHLHAGGMTTHALEQEIALRLKGKANQPEAVVRITHNASSNVTIVGEVTGSVRMPLTAGGERVLDALAAAGGVRQPVNKITLQITRGATVQSLPLDWVIRDPKQNVPLRSGDVVTALFQPLSFTALGATNKNDEITFEAQGITLAQALARSGGLVDTRSDPKGVFIFRLEQRDALEWPHQPVMTTPEGLVPVVYRLDLKDPRSFFVMQTFAVNDKDVLYVSNAPITEVQKFLNVVFSFAYPVLNAVEVSRY